MALARLDVERLSAPISSVSPAGEDVRKGASVELYYRLKDARSAARAEERAQAPGGEAPKIPQAWSDVRALSVELLEGATSDIEILAWLMEAELRLSGLSGLAQAFRLATLLVQDRFDVLHSIDGDGIADKVAPLAGLNGMGGEGTLIQPIRLSPLVPGHAFFSCSLWDFQLAQRPGQEARREALRDAVAEAGDAAMRAHLGVVSDCLFRFNELTGELDRRCGADAPASSAIRGILEETRLAVINLSGLDGAAIAAPPAEAEQAPAGQTGTGQAAEAARQAAPAGPIRTREEAFERLVAVADFFRRSEPQSPLALAIDTIVARGRMDFAALIAELVQDEQTRRNILITAGIRPNSGGQP